MEIIKNIICPIITAYLTTIITFHFKEKEYRNRLMIEKNYDTFVNLRDNLKDFFTEVTEKYDFWGYLTKNKKLLRDINNRYEIDFKKYTERQEKEGIFCDYNKVELYLDYIKKFEKVFLKDILKITKLSLPNIKKIVIKIENIYMTSEKGEHSFFDPLRDEIGDKEWFENENKYLGYINFKKNAYWGECWLKILPLLKKLKNNLENVVDIKKI